LSEQCFSSLQLQPELLKNLQSLSYEEMTPVQAKSLPSILSGKDVIAQAKTGSGKTAAFGLGILANLDLKNYQPQSLILCPTRELADQVANALRQLARTLPNVKILTLCGGVPIRTQVKSLSHGAHIVVGTPGRIAKHLRKEYLTLASLTTLVLDEGDRMLEMGFQEQLDDIINAAPKKRQTLLFSATYPPAIQSIAKRVMKNPEMVKVDDGHDELTIKQHFYKVGSREERMTALRLLLLKHRPKSAVIFCNTKNDAMDVTDELLDFGFSALDLHGDLDQVDRDDTLARFANKSVSILVATDVAARGLDIESLDMVINFFTSSNPEVHVHRIGRTGRAGDKGMACSLYSEKESFKMGRIGEYIGQEIVPEELPSKAVLNDDPVEPEMVSIKMRIGKKQKLRAGTLLGILTGENGIKGSEVGKIQIFDNQSYIAVKREVVKQVLRKLSKENWKNRPIKAWKVGN